MKNPIANVDALIQDLENVIVVEDGRVVRNTLSEIAGLTIETLDANQRLNEDFAAITVENEMVKSNEKNRETTLYFRVSKNVRLKKPIHLFFKNTKSSIHQTAVLLEEGATLSLFEYLYDTQIASANYLFKAKVSEHAVFDYTSLTRHHRHSHTSLHRLLRLGGRSKATVQTAQMGDDQTHQETDMLLLGERAQGTIKTIALTNRQQEAVVRTNIDHKAQRSEGLIEHYGVANDQSFLAFEGVGRIRKGMVQSVAKQSNRGVILGANARLDANPLLYIDEYDIEASHGAAIGKIDEEQLYYLMSRGLSEKAAQRLIIRGFLAPLEALMQNEKFDKHIHALLANKIE